MCGLPAEFKTTLMPTRLGLGSIGNYAGIVWVIFHNHIFGFGLDSESPFRDTMLETLRQYIPATELTTEMAPLGLYVLVSGHCISKHRYPYLCSH